MHDTIFVGMDVHTATISVAVAYGERGGEVRHLGNFLNRADQIGKVACRAPQQDWRSVTAVLLRSRPVRLWVASADHRSWP
jgi:hypothetical protein